MTDGDGRVSWWGLAALIVLPVGLLAGLVLSSALVLGGVLVVWSVLVFMEGSR